MSIRGARQAPGPVSTAQVTSLSSRSTTCVFRICPTFNVYSLLLILFRYGIKAQSMIQLRYNGLNESTLYVYVSHRIMFRSLTPFYQETKGLPSTNVLYGKGLWRLRTLCSQTTQMPSIFDVTESFTEDPGPAEFVTVLSDVPRGRNEHRVVALKLIRCDKDDMERYKRVSLTTQLDTSNR
jgi:hypothetical protein